MAFTLDRVRRVYRGKAKGCPIVRGGGSKSDHEGNDQTRRESHSCPAFTQGESKGFTGIVSTLGYTVPRWKEIGASGRREEGGEGVRMWRVCADAAAFKGKFRPDAHKKVNGAGRWMQVSECRRVEG